MMSTPLRKRVHLLAVTDAAVNDGDAQIGEAREIANGGFHLRGQFARGFEDQARAGAGCAGRACERMGRANAAVLPVPVCALPMTSCPAMNQRNGAQLDGRRLDVTHRLDAVE